MHRVSHVDQAPAMMVMNARLHGFRAPRSVRTSRAGLPLKHQHQSEDDLSFAHERRYTRFEPARLG